MTLKDTIDNHFADSPLSNGVVHSQSMHNGLLQRGTSRDGGRGFVENTAWTEAVRRSSSDSMEVNIK